MSELPDMYFPELRFWKIIERDNSKRNERKIFGGSKMKTDIQEELELCMSKSVAQASNKEIYDALLVLVQKMAAGKERTGEQRDKAWRGRKSGNVCCVVFSDRAGKRGVGGAAGI